jgi:quinohemoprotein ethanol dehydrogenase
MGTEFSDEGVDLANWQAVEFEGGVGVDINLNREERDYPASLIAWDPVTQEKAWEIPQDHFWNAGTLTTAGNLVFQGRSDGMLLAYDAATGDIVWENNAGLGISAPPITYKIDGTQYISLLVGWGGGYAGLGGLEAAGLGWAYGEQTRRLITFSLEGTADMPPLAPPRVPQPIAAPEFIVDFELAEKGEALYGKCSACHGPETYSGGMAPDLRASAIPLNEAAFEQIVKEGGSVTMGMPKFSELSEDDLLALRHYIRHRAIIQTIE